MKKVKSTRKWEDLKDLFLKYRMGENDPSFLVFSQLQGILTGFYQVRMGPGPEVDDMVQTALLKIHFGRDKFNEKLSLKTWVFTIAQRALIDHWRTGAKDRENLLDISVPYEDEEHLSELENLKDPTLDLAQSIEIQGDLTKAFEKLKPLERSIVYLYAVEGMSMSEIAGIHGFTEGAMKVRVHRACQQLKNLLLALIIFILTRESI